MQSKTRQRLMTDEQKEAEATSLEVLSKELEKNRRVIAATFDTDNGRRALRMIMERCNYQKPISYRDGDGIVNINNMIHNGALQGFYLWLRKQIDTETLIKVENKGLDEDEIK